MEYTKEDIEAIPFAGLKYFLLDQQTLIQIEPVYKGKLLKNGLDTKCCICSF